MATNEDARFPKRVAVLTGSLALGGATTFLLNLGSEFIRAGGNFRVYCLEGSVPPDFASAGIPVETPGTRNRWFEERICWAIERLSGYDPHAVIANLSPIAFEPLRYVPRGVQRIGMAHTDEPGIYTLIDQYRQWLDCAIAVSERIRDEILRRQIVPEGGVHLIRYGVPMPPDDWARFSSATDPLRVLYLGRLSKEQKRADLLPEIHALVSASSVRTSWTIAGDGELRSSLEEQLAPLGVVFLGAVNYSEVPGILQRHDVLLLPSAYEGLPLSLLEAMAFEVVPVISDLQSGVREVVDESTGILVPTAQIHSYAKGIIDLCEDRDRLKRLGKAGRLRVFKLFSTRALFERWRSILDGQCSANWTAPRIKPPIGMERSLRFFPPFRWMIRRIRDVRIWIEPRNR